jgi:hypothetical protein
MVLKNCKAKEMFQMEGEDFFREVLSAVICDTEPGIIGILKRNLVVCVVY